MGLLARYRATDNISLNCSGHTRRLAARFDSPTRRLFNWSSILKILVVGGAGYIGSVVCEHLLKSGFELVVLDNLSKGHAEALLPQARFIKGDMGSSADLDRAFAEKPQAIMHFGALSLVGESVQKPALYYKNNVVSGLLLLDRAMKEGVNKFVFSSTAAVYGNPASCPIDEEFPLQPSSPYGDSKLAFEKILKSYSEAYGLRYATLRYFNAAGATANFGEDHNPETHLIPSILDVARGVHRHATIFGDDYPTQDGTCVRDYVHVSDLADAHVLALDAISEHQSQIYNLGSETGFSVKQVIEAVRQITGKDIPVQVGPRRAGDPAVLIASSARIKKQLGWSPSKTNLETIIADAWNFKQKNPHGYKKEASNVCK